MRKLLLLFTLAPCLAFGQLTYVPDDNFENYLENNGMGDGIANNDSVLTANISSVDSLDVTLSNIFDLTGIEDFTALTYLNCQYNQLTSLDVSNNTALTDLYCYNNQLTSLDVNGATALIDLRCQGNQLTSLDVSNNTALTELYCYWNQLTCLDVKNGNNSNFLYFLSHGNPNLTCIEVDDAAWSTTFWTSIDPQTSFSDDCNYPASCWIVGIEEELPTKDTELLYITDVLGRTTYPAPNTLLFYIYEDGSVEKKMQLER